jgi:hypothetical protein
MIQSVYFNVGEFDQDGDLITDGIYLHFGETRIRVAEDIEGYRDFVSELQRMEKEIEETVNA